MTAPPWEQVQEILDRGGDPMGDPEVARAAAVDSLFLDDLALLRVHLRAVARHPVPRRTPATMWWTGAALLAAVVPLVLFLGPPTAPDTLSPPAPDIRYVSVTWSTTRGTTTWRREGAREEFTDRRAPGSSSPVLFLDFTTTTNADSP